MFHDLERLFVCRVAGLASEELEKSLERVFDAAYLAWLRNDHVLR